MTFASKNIADDSRWKSEQPKCGKTSRTSPMISSLPTPRERKKEKKLLQRHRLSEDATSAIIMGRRVSQRRSLDKALLRTILNA
ncbi:Protein of unknown function, partial [Gryllus bimaculatus]